MIVPGGGDRAQHGVEFSQVNPTTRVPMRYPVRVPEPTGSPPILYQLTESKDVRWGRPYLNYLLCLAALSHHLDAPPRSFLEVGGGFGVLGEVVMQREPEARYVNLVIAPLVTVASYYLSTIFGLDRVLTPDLLPAEGQIEVPRAGCIPSWRTPDVIGPFDVFVNSYSFRRWNLTSSLTTLPGSPASASHMSSR